MGHRNVGRSRRETNYLLRNICQPLFSYSYRHIVSVRPLFKRKEEAVCLRQKGRGQSLFFLGGGCWGKTDNYTSLYTYVCVHVPVIETYQYNYTAASFLVYLWLRGRIKKNEGWKIRKKRFFLFFFKWPQSTPPSPEYIFFVNYFFRLCWWLDSLHEREYLVSDYYWIKKKKNPLGRPYFKCDWKILRCGRQMLHRHVYYAKWCWHSSEIILRL